MKELLGRQFSVADAIYSVVDVRNVDGEMFVYAEIDTQQTASLPSAESHMGRVGKGPGRASFRYVDIEQQLDDNRNLCCQA